MTLAVSFLFLSLATMSCKREGRKGRFIVASGPSNLALIAPGSVRQRQKFAKTNIVIGGGTEEERRRTGTKNGTHIGGRRGLRRSRRSVGRGSVMFAPRAHAPAHRSGSLSSFFGVIPAGPLGRRGPQRYKTFR